MQKDLDCDMLITYLRGIKVNKNLYIMKIEFYSFEDERTQSEKMQLLDSSLSVLATLDGLDFKKMEVMKLQKGILQDIVTYCNKYKGTDIKDFTPTVF